jgi:hypothetical protein
LWKCDPAFFENNFLTIKFNNMEKAKLAIHAIVSRPTLSPTIYRMQSSLSAHLTIEKQIKLIEDSQHDKGTINSFKSHIFICNEFEKMIRLIIQNNGPFAKGTYISIEDGSRLAVVDDWQYHYDKKFSGLVLRVYMHEISAAI